MKTREGFVGNSSTSSFIVAVKGELTVEKLMKWARIPDDSPLHSIAEDLVGVLVGAAEKTYSKVEEYEEDLKNDDIGENTDIPKYISEGFTVHAGTLSTEGEADEWTMANLEIDYKSDDLIIRHDSRF